MHNNMGLPAGFSFYIYQGSYTSIDQNSVVFISSVLVAMLIILAKLSAV